MIPINLLIFVISISIALGGTTNNFKVITDEDSNPYKEIPDNAINPDETDISYWHSKGKKLLNDKINQKLNTNTAKNVIIFMGDGMSIPTITAARIYDGQLNKKSGEENQLSFEKFPYVGLSKTYSVDKQVPDSASTATAYLRGVKTNFYTLGVTAKVKPADCESAKLEANRPTSILKWAQDSGKATGVVTNTRITDASPAGAYAHVPYRYMECDHDVVKSQLDPKSCNFDIAQQMIDLDVGKNMNVFMGGGRNKFLPKEGPSQHGQGERLDEDLILKWKKDKETRKKNGVYVTTTEELLNVDAAKTDHLLGLFAPSHMEYHTNRPENQPTLSQMVEKAIEVLQKEKNGFVLFVEGGLIDDAHHFNQAKRALVETIEFSKAVEVALKKTNENDTLTIVTSDHSHTMSISGYPRRGNDILGLYGKSKNNLPYSTLSYANGPGFLIQKTPGIEKDLTNDNINDPEYKFSAMVPKEYESHGGDDVAVFARGPWAHLLSGNYEQNYIPIVAAHAAGIELPLPPKPEPPKPDQPSHPDDKPEVTTLPPVKHNSSTRFLANSLTIMISICVLSFKNILISF